MKTYNMFYRAAILFCASLWLTAPGWTTEQVDTALREQIVTYWTAVAERDWSTTFGLEKPPEDEEPINPLTYYRQKDAELRFRNWALESIETQGADQATAQVKTTLILPLGERAVDIPRTFISEWQRIEGTWYHVSSAPKPRQGDNEDDASGNAQNAPEASAPVDSGVDGEVAPRGGDKSL
jgi:hypothetical protein